MNLSNRRLYLDICWEPIRDNAGNVVGVASATVDLTPIKLAEEALRESEERFRSSFDNAAIGFRMTAMDGCIVDANPAYCEITGYSIDELRAMKVTRLIHPQDRATNRSNDRADARRRNPGLRGSRTATSIRQATLYGCVRASRQYAKTVRRGGSSLWLRISLNVNGLRRKINTCSKQ